MKTTLLFLFFFNSILGYTQEVTVQKKSSIEYSFSHAKPMDQLRIERYKVRMLTECVDLNTINFSGQVCTITLKNNVSTEKINEAILYCITKFGFQTYKIEE